MGVILTNGQRFCRRSSIGHVRVVRNRHLGSAQGLGMGLAVGMHRCHELLKEVVGIMGARAGFGVVLDGEERQGFVLKPCYGLIVQVEVADGHGAGG